MIRKLIVWSLSQPSLGYSTVRALRAYRKAQEKLRISGEHYADLAEAQLIEAIRTANVSEPFLRAAVARWMELEPLKSLVKVRRAGLIESLKRFKSNGISLGVVSDYPARPKLQALGVDDLFDVVVSSQDIDVGEFKPSPRGLLIALDRLGVTPREAVYVGDRTDVDAKAACNAGVDCVTIGRTRPACETHHRHVSNFLDLFEVILGDSVGPRRCISGTIT